MRIICLALFLMMISYSCKKDESGVVKIYGVVSNTDGSPAAGVTIRMSYQEVGNNSYSTAYTSGGFVVSANDGSYAFEFESPRASSYKFQFSSPLHFSKEVTENAETISRDNKRDHSVDAYSWLSVRIKNTSPMGAGDQIIFQNINESSSYSGCCNNTVSTFNGMNIDTVLTCLRPSGTEIKFKWIVSKASIISNYSDSVTTTPYDTLFYNLNY